MELNMLHCDTALGEQVPTCVEGFVTNFNHCMINPSWVKSNVNTATHDNQFWVFHAQGHMAEPIQRTIRQIALASAWGAVTFTFEKDSGGLSTTIRVFKDPIRL
jgi:hypothetical protein